MGFSFKREAETLPTADLRRAHEYWCSMQGKGGLPCRADLDPAAIVDLLPKINLVDVVGTGGLRRYRHRLVGTGVVNLFRSDATGCWFDDVHTAEHLDTHLPAYDRVVDTGIPSAEEISMALEACGRQIALSYWRLIMPMTRSGDGIDMLMLVFDNMGDTPGWGTPLPQYLPTWGTAAH